MPSPESQGAPAPSTIGRRERKKQATRVAVREAALRLVARHGVQNVTIDQIADEADISPRTFLNYFSTKEEALVAAATSGVDAIVEAFRSRPAAESVLEAIRGAVFAIVAEGTGASPAHVDALWMIRTAPSLVPYQLALMSGHEAGLAEAIAERVGSQDDHDDIYPALCAAAAIAVLRITLDRWFTRFPGSGPVDLDAFRAEFDRGLRHFAEGLERPRRG